MSVQICTIIARNYLPFARVLATSFLEHNPGGRVAVLVIDDVDGDVDPRDEPFEVVRPDEIGLEAGEFHRMAMIYDLVELATSLKPWLIRCLLARSGTEPVIYLDPDIRVFAPLDEVSALAERYGVVLTPHVTAPIPRDGRMTDENTILSAGMYNLGFIAVGAGAQSFLDFWMERLSRECRVDVTKNLFVDQRWIDFVPSAFGGHVLRDPSYNVAYWNLDHRDLCWTGDGYQVDGVPLHFFHFSGFDTAAPSVLSKWQGSRPRVLLSERPDLARMCAEYAGAVRAATRGGEFDTRYGFADLPNGIPIDEEMRELYRQRLEAAESGGTAPPPDPFTAEGAEEFLDWACSPSSEPGHRAPRYLALLHSQRPPLRDAFPALHGSDYDAFLDWAGGEAAAGRLPRRLVPPGRLPEAAVLPGVRWAPVGSLRPGMSLVTDGPPVAGSGNCSGLLAAAAREAGIEVETVLLEAVGDPPRLRPAVAGAASLNVGLIAIGPTWFARFMKDAGSPFLDTRYTIGVLTCEPGELPGAWKEALSRLDEVWAISEPIRMAVEAVTECPVFAFPLPVVAPAIIPDLDRRALGLPDGLIFLSRVDFRAGLERANPGGLVEAFAEGFAPGEGPTLVLVAVKGEHHLAELEALKLQAVERSDVLVIDRDLDTDESAALTGACDCYVTLDPTQLSGLPLAEAVALGKPVVAVEAPGGLDLVDTVSAYLIPANAGSPELDAVARLMRRIVEHPDEARAIGLRARDDVLSRHAPATRARFVGERFEHAQKVLAARSAGAASRATGAPGRLPPSLAEFAGSRADPRSPSRFPLVSRPLRRLVSRLTAHGDTHRAVVDRRLAEALLQLESRLDEIDRRLRVTADGLDEPGSAPAQLAALREQTFDRLSQLDARLRLLSEPLGERVDRVAKSGDQLAGYAKPPADAVSAVDAGASGSQSQAIDALASREEPGKLPRMVRAK
ncbi:MAG: glycosyltransferase [Candidatus Dormibacteria bacterium]|jgi:hypothetical protein